MQVHIHTNLWRKMHVLQERNPQRRIPVLTRWEMKIKSLGQKEETEQETELSKRNLV